MISLKNFIKQKMPFIADIYKLIKNIYRLSKNKKIIKNYFKTNYKKNALLSYITLPFKKGLNYSHTNYFEAICWAKILSGLGYNIDIINYNNQKVDLLKYDLICGFGEVFQQYFESGLSKKIYTIYYGTGMHVCNQNHTTLQRVKDVWLKKGVWLGKSARFVEKTWTHQTLLVDGIVALGNEICAQSYKKYYDGKIFSIPVLFFKVLDGKEIIENRQEHSNKSFLWFGSSGLIHKGLDLLLDFFVNRKDLTLHICGPIENEPDFIRVYKKELYETKNIITHGFIDLQSKEFKEILASCSFIIFPSCSEGSSPSVLTVIGNGGLIPVITKETTISTGNEIWIEELTIDGIQKAVNTVLSLNSKQIKEMQIKNLEYVISNHSQEVYFKKLKFAIQSILEDTKN